MDIVHLRHNEAATGCVKTELFEDNLFYEKMMGSERAAVATSHYCPSCSKTQEYDRKLGRYKKKFRISKEDYIFNLHYNVDENGELYGYCKSCDYDIRINNVDGVGHSEDDIKIVRDYEIIDYAEQNSCYVIEFKAFMEFFSNKKKGTITDMIINKKVGEENYKYTLSIDNIDVKKLKVNSGKYIEIPKSYWKSEGKRV
tara:strand:+ start:3418 stop:4014 length:597 start_codon:yes stop_codon:yes gene_type:complete